MKISSNICTLSSTFYLGVVVRLKSSAPILSQGCRCHIVTSYCTWCTLSTGHLHQCNYLSLMKLPSSIGRMVQVIIQQRNPLDKIFPVFGRPLVVPTVVQMWASYIKGTHLRPHVTKMPKAPILQIGPVSIGRRKHQTTRYGLDKHAISQKRRGWLA